MNHSIESQIADSNMTALEPQSPNPNAVPPLRLAPAPRQRVLLARKSWVTYLRPGFWLLVWGGVAPALVWSHWLWLGLVSIAVGTAAAIYRILWLRSELLWMDEYGITHESGLFPWQRGKLRVRWRDIETIGCERGILQWALNFSTVVVWQRFTDTATLVATEMAGGARVCSVLNGVHLQWINDHDVVHTRDA